jgi:hypothetical protein
VLARGVGYDDCDQRRSETDEMRNHGGRRPDDIYTRSELREAIILGQGTFGLGSQQLSKSDQHGVVGSTAILPAGR